MQRQRDTNGTGRRLGRLLLGVSMLALLGGCGLFSASSPPGAAPRPGAERQVAPTAALPPAASGRAYEQGTVGVDETRGGGAIGSIVPGKGGQKAQKEAVEKEQIERDKKDREERWERDAEEKAQRAKDKEAEKMMKAAGGTPPASAAPGAVPSVDPGPAAVPAVPPSAPVTTATIPVPPQPATDAAPAAQPGATPALPVPTPPGSAAPAPVPEKQSSLPADTRLAGAPRTGERADIFASL